MPAGTSRTGSRSCSTACRSTARVAAHFSANQLRVLLTAAAYVLMQELRLRAAGTACARTQVTWLRDRLLKLGVQVVRSVRRLVLHLPRATPQREAWQRIALALGARAG